MFGGAFGERIFTAFWSTLSLIRPPWGIAMGEECYIDFDEIGRAYVGFGGGVVYTSSLDW